MMSQNGPPPPFRILYAEDNPINRKVTEAIINKLLPEVQVEGVADGESALAKMGQVEFDLLLTDMQMPGINGLELLERARKEHPNVLTAVLSAYYPSIFSHGTVSKCRQLPILFWQVKPVRAEEFKERIQRAMRLRELFRLQPLAAVPNANPAVSPFSAADLATVLEDVKWPVAEAAERRRPDVAAGPADTAYRLYPFLIGGLIHNALNTAVSLEYYLSRAGASSQGAKAIMLPARVSAYITELDVILGLMQQVTRSFYAPSDQMSGTSPVAGIVKNFAVMNQGVLYDCAGVELLDAVSIPAGATAFIVGELLKNATKACAGRTGSTVSLGVTVKDSGNLVSIECRDTGPGFPPEVLSRIYEQRLRPPQEGGATGFGRT